MEPTRPAKPKPATGVVRTFGYLNIIFGGLLVLFGPCPGIFMVFGIPYLRTIQVSAEESVQKRREGELRALDEQEKRAETEDQKLRIRAERRRIESQPLPVMTTFDTDQFGLNDRRVRTHYLLEALSCIAVNILLITAGIGLLRRRAWGRSISIAVGLIKIARLLAFLLSYLLIVQPALRPGLIAALRQPPRAGVAPAPEAEAIALADATQMMNAVVYIVIFLFGVIYPVLLIAFLSGRAARAAVTTSPGDPETL